jgi:hypothetical protein
MSRRRDRRQTGERHDRAGQSERASRPGRPGRADRSGVPNRADGRSGPTDRRLRAGILRDVGIVVAAFGAGVGAAELFGAANLGVALGVGQVVFALTLIVLLTRA